MDMDQKEILRYLGYKRSDAPDAQTLERIEAVINELQTIADPKYVFRIFPIKKVEEDIVDLGFVRLESHDLAKNLKGCQEAALMAATLGNGVDLRLQKYNRLEMSRAVILQAAATEAIEKYCDFCEEEILRQAGECRYLCPRFSPGYGDFSLEYQKVFLQILEAGKKIGLTLTDGFLMMPSKSVTAVIGISREQKDGHNPKCEYCEKEDCPYRRE